MSEPKFQVAMVLNERTYKTAAGASHVLLERMCHRQMPSLFNVRNQQRGQYVDIQNRANKAPTPEERSEARVELARLTADHGQAVAEKYKRFKARVYDICVNAGMKA